MDSVAVVSKEVILHEGSSGCRYGLSSERHQKLSEWFSIAILVDERQERHIEFVERLDAEEDVVGVAFYAC